MVAMPSRVPSIGRVHAPADLEIQFGQRLRTRNGRPSVGPRNGFRGDGRYRRAIAVAKVKSRNHAKPPEEKESKG